jgi:nucleotide-binding universal stress UspA family protein
MALESVPAGSIVVGVDGSEPSHQALEWAADEADRRHLPLHVIHALDLPYWELATPSGPADSLRARKDEVAQVLLSQVHRGTPGVQVTAQTPHGAPAAMLVEASQAADSVVVGSRGRGGMRSALLGSVSQQVAGHAHCPVVVVRRSAEDGHGGRGVVLGVDGTASSSAATSYAFAHASSLGARLTVVHAWWWQHAESLVHDDAPRSGDWEKIREGEARLVEESLAAWSMEYPDVERSLRVERGHPVEVLVAESAGAELLVVGSRGRGGVSGLMLGSVSQEVLHHPGCPVAVVGGSKVPAA